MMGKCFDPGNIYKNVDQEVREYVKCQPAFIGKYSQAVGSALADTPALGFDHIKLGCLSPAVSISQHFDFRGLLSGEKEDYGVQSGEF